MRCRTQGGRLHLVENVGKIALADVTLVEDPNEEDGRAAEDDEGERARLRARVLRGWRCDWAAHI